MTDTLATLDFLRSTIPAQEKGIPITASANQMASLVHLLGFQTWLSEENPLKLEEALRLSAVSICADVISQDFAKTPLYLKQWRNPNASERVQGHWLADLFDTEPNEDHTWYELKQMIMLHLVFVQNAFLVKKMRRNGQVDEIIPVLPGRVRILVDEEIGEYVYEVWHDTPHERAMMDGVDLDDTRRTYFRKDQIIHIRSRMIDGLYGYSNLVAGASSMGLFKSITDYQTRLYKNDASLRGVFQKKDEHVLSEEAFKRLRKQLAEAMQKLRDENRPIVTEQGMEFKPISMSADQAEAVKARDQAVVDVCRLFRVPPHKAMHLINVKYENMETLEKSYLSDTMVPYFVNVEERLKRDLLVARKDRARYFPWFDREAIELHDPEKQAKVIEAMRKIAAMTVDEARQRRDMNPIGGDIGNSLLVPSSFTMISPAGDVLVQAAGQTNESDSGTAEETQDDE